MRGTRQEKPIVRYEVWMPWSFVNGELIWGWVPYKRLNPFHQFAKRRQVRL